METKLQLKQLVEKTSAESLNHLITLLKHIHLLYYYVQQKLPTCMQEVMRRNKGIIGAFLFLYSF